MDNLTHSLIGVAFARSLPKRLRRPEIYWASILGNNAPDSDFVVSLLPGADRLDYLVHHRGITHTLFLAPAMALLTAFVALRLARKREWRVDLLAVSLFACLLHVAADFMNSYGVHPFSPISDRWYFGDAVFIVEPLIWFAILPFIAREAERRWARAAWWILAIPMLALVWTFPLYSTTLSASVTAFAAVAATLAVVIRRGAVRAATTALLLAGVVGGFFAAGAEARRIARGYWQSATEGTETWMDASSTPLPSNPLCWTVWTAAKAADGFRMRSAVVSVRPSFVTPDECDPLPRKDRTADVRPSSLPPGRSVRWDEEARLDGGEFRALREKSPTFRRFLAFARFPFVRRHPDGRVVVGDLRFDRDPGLGFAEFELPADEKEDTSVGAWEPPFRAGP